MISRDGNNFDVACDRCSAGATSVEAETFKEAVRLIREEGWVVRPDGEGDFTHVCPECIPNG